MVKPISQTELVGLQAKGPNKAHPNFVYRKTPFFCDVSLFLST